MPTVHMRCEQSPGPCSVDIRTSEGDRVTNLSGDMEPSRVAVMRLEFGSFDRRLNVKEWHGPHSEVQANEEVGTWASAQV